MMNDTNHFNYRLHNSFASNLRDALGQNKLVGIALPFQMPRQIAGHWDIWNKQQILAFTSLFLNQYFFPQPTSLEAYLQTAPHGCASVHPSGVWWRPAEKGTPVALTCQWPRAWPMDLFFSWKGMWFCLFVGPITRFLYTYSTYANRAELFMWVFYHMDYSPLGSEVKPIKLFHWSSSCELDLGCLNLPPNWKACIYP